MGLPPLFRVSRFERHESSGGKPTFPTCYYFNVRVAIHFDPQGKQAWELKPTSSTLQPHGVLCDTYLSSDVQLQPVRQCSLDCHPEA